MRHLTKKQALRFLHNYRKKTLLEVTSGLRSLRLRLQKKQNRLDQHQHQIHTLANALKNFQRDHQRYNQKHEDLHLQIQSLKTKI